MTRKCRNSKLYFSPRLSFKGLLRAFYLCEGFIFVPLEIYMNIQIEIRSINLFFLLERFRILARCNFACISEVQGS